MDVVGVDVGGTKVAAVLVDPDGAVLHQARVEHGIADYPGVLSALAESVDVCRARSSAGVVAVGLSVAGWLSADRDHVIYAANLGCRDRPLRRDLADRLGLPVAIDNDGNAAALAEARLGAGRGASVVVMLTLGTGVGGGIVVDGDVWTGAHGFGAELGHVPTVVGGPECLCGGRGCLELYAGGVALARAAAAAVAVGASGPLAGDRDGRPFTGLEVVEAALAGDPVATALVVDAGRHTAEALKRIAPVVDPDVVVVGGGVGVGGAALVLPAIRAGLAAGRPLGAVRPAPPVVLAALGPAAGALGAAELARDAVRPSASRRRPR